MFAQENNGVLEERLKKTKKIYLNLMEQELGQECNEKNLYWQDLLSMAATYDDPDAVELAIKNHADVNQVNSIGYTPLHVAAGNGYLAIVEMLLKNHGDVSQVDKIGWTPLLVAAEHGHIAVVETLLKNRADLDHADMFGWTPLLLAARNGHLAVVEALIKRGANPNLCDSNGRTPFAVACGHRQVRVAYALLRNEALTHLQFYFAFIPFIRNMYRLMLESLVPATVSSRFTPLQTACLFGHLSTVEKLLQQGADVHQVNAFDDDALCLAIRGGHLEVAEALLKKHATLNRQTTAGDTPLSIAIEAGHIAMVTLLLENGADLSLTANDELPIELSQRLEKPEISALIDEQLRKHTFLTLKETLQVARSASNEPDDLKNTKFDH